LFASLQAPSKPGMHTELLELLSCLLFVNTIVVTVYARQITQHNSPLELVVWAAISMCIFTFVTMHLKVLQQRFLQAHSTNRDSCKHILQTEIPASTFYKQMHVVGSIAEMWQGKGPSLSASSRPVCDTVCVCVCVSKKFGSLSKYVLP